MKKAIGVLCILGAYGSLISGSGFFGAAFIPLFAPGSASHASPLVAFLGVVTGLIGAGLLFAGLKLCWEKEEAPAPVLPESIMGFGLLFPGSAQAYAGRWLPALAFLLFPFVVIFACLLAAAFEGIVFGARSTPVIGGLVNVFTSHILAVYLLLWIASLAEGWRWFSALPANPPNHPIPRGKASVIGLGLVAYLFVFFMMLVASAVMLVLHGAKALHPESVASAPAAVVRDPRAALEHHQKAMALSRTDLRAAAQEWEQAIAADSEVPTYQYDLATTYWLLGDRARAVPYFQRYLQMRPNDAYSQGIHEKLASIGVRDQN